VRPPHPVLNPFDNPNLNQEGIPSHHGYPRNGKARLKPFSNYEKPMPMMENEPNRQIHVPQLGNYTCNLLPTKSSC